MRTFNTTIEQYTKDDVGAAKDSYIQHTNNWNALMDVLTKDKEHLIPLINFLHKHHEEMSKEHTDLESCPEDIKELMMDIESLLEGLGVTNYEFS